MRSRQVLAKKGWFFRSEEGSSLFLYFPLYFSNALKVIQKLMKSTEAGFQETGKNNRASNINVEPRLFLLDTNFAALFNVCPCFIQTLVKVQGSTIVFNAHPFSKFNFLETGFSLQSYLFCAVGPVHHFRCRRRFQLHWKCCSISVREEAFSNWT